MTTSQNSFKIARHAGLIAAMFLWCLLVTVVLLLGGFRREILDEGIRLAVSLITIALLSWQWVLYRKTTSGTHFAFLAAVLATLSLPAVWLALNVIRFYTYDGDNTDSLAGSVHHLVIRVQEGLVWACFVAIAVALVLGVSDIFRTLKANVVR